MAKRKLFDLAGKERPILEPLRLVATVILAFRQGLVSKSPAESKNCRIIERLPKHFLIISLVFLLIIMSANVSCCAYVCLITELQIKEY